VSDSSAPWDGAAADRPSTEWTGDLERYLRVLWDEPGLTVAAAKPFGHGNSGYTYLVELAKTQRRGRQVLRLSPPGVRIAGSADIGRQARIMAALGERGFPVPTILAADSAPCIQGRSFALMELVVGEECEAVTVREAPETVAGAAIDVLHRLAVLSPESSGIGDEIPRTPLGEIERWNGLMARSPVWLRTAASEFARILASTAPAPTTPRLVHGDFHYGNLLFRGQAVCAVLDWEIAELGDPRMDLGCLAVAALRSRYLPEPNPTGHLDLSAERLIEIYGRPDDAAWFVAASCFKYAAILGYNLALHESGRRRDPIYAQLTGTMRGLMADGAQILRSGLGGW
jgi:aminoglycoside phosphotransferase (APT) family kinase protein